MWGAQVPGQICWASVHSVEFWTTFIMGFHAGSGVCSPLKSGPPGPSANWGWEGIIVPPYIEMGRPLEKSTKLFGIGCWKMFEGATIPESSLSIGWCWEKAPGSDICWCTGWFPITGWDQPDKPSETLLTPKDQIPLWPTGAVKLVPNGVGVTEPPCLIRASLSVPMGGGTFRSWAAFPDFGWLRAEGADVADRGEDDPEETDGIGDSPDEETVLLLYHLRSIPLPLLLPYILLYCISIQLPLLLLYILFYWISRPQTSGQRPFYRLPHLTVAPLWIPWLLLYPIFYATVETMFSKETSLALNLLQRA